MSDSIPSASISRTRLGQAHYVSAIDETGLGAVDSVADESAPSSMWGEAWKKLRKRPLFWVSAVIIAAVILISLFPSLFASQDPKFCELGKSLADPEPGHPFGYNLQGCDIYARTIYGARASVSVGILSTLGTTILGTLLGSLAGSLGGWVDALISRIIDIFYSIPFLIASIIVMQMFKEQRNVLMVSIVLSAFAWVGVARLMRGSVMSTKNDEFVTAAFATGASKMRILMSHIVPNAIAPVIVSATLALGGFIVAEAGLSFLGIGLPPSIVSWGADISAAQDSINVKFMVLVYPSIFLALTVLGFIMLGDAVQDALDPKAREK